MSVKHKFNIFEKKLYNILVILVICVEILHDFCCLLPGSGSSRGYRTHLKREKQKKKIFLNWVKIFYFCMIISRR